MYVCEVLSRIGKLEYNHALKIYRRCGEITVQYEIAQFLSL